MRAFQGTVLYLVIALIAASASATAAIPVCPDSGMTSHASVRDFNFLIGDWNVHNRRLKRRLAHSDALLEFEATDSFRALPGGPGTEEHYATDFWKGYTALGLHLYDPEHRSWVLYWADNRNVPGTMQALARGGFVDGVGVFCAPDTFNGMPITLRIVWKRIDARHVRWEQAFSTDRGRSWETNWTMDFRRR